ncbi:MAG TPA: cupin domain-containing protein, partial [Thermodesulfobacteriota bacterium]|nr:cupin domain-containing protein [Thermodesulfobacteriota bacterium]
GDKRYYWNTGMFAFTAGTMLEELGKFAPGIRKLLDGSYDEVLSNFREMPEISIDYAVMEKSRKVVTVPMDIYWNDIGSWDSVFEMLKKDKQGNAFDGDVVAVDTTGTMVIGKKRLIATVGLHDCLVVETDDAVLIAQKGDTQKLKEIVKRLNGRKEVTEHLTVYRPWGSYTLLEKGPSYKIKKVVVKPQQKLSLQMHYHRSEHWVVVSGMAKVTIGDEEKLVHINESIYVPKGTYHRLENPGEISLEIIEVQNGEYLEEDDIVRFEDSYGRD